MTGLIQHLHDRVWADLPLQVSLRQRLIAAFSWGGVLMALAAFKFWRIHHGHSGSVPVAAGLAIAGVILFGLLLLPSPGETLYLAIMRVFMVFGFVFSHIALTLAFYLFVTPMGWIMRRCGMDLLDTRPGTRPTWKTHHQRTDRKRYYRLS
nr:hypothetical protein JG4_0070 [uncultured bacterium]